MSITNETSKHIFKKRKLNKDIFPKNATKVRGKMEYKLISAHGKGTKPAAYSLSLPYPHVQNRILYWKQKYCKRRVRCDVSWEPALASRIPTPAIFSGGQRQSKLMTHVFYFFFKCCESCPTDAPPKSGWQHRLLVHIHLPPPPPFDDIESINETTKKTDAPIITTKMFTCLLALAENRIGMLWFQCLLREWRVRELTALALAHKYHQCWFRHWNE